MKSLEQSSQVAKLVVVFEAMFELGWDRMIDYYSLHISHFHNNACCKNQYRLGHSKAVSHPSGGL